MDSVIEPLAGMVGIRRPLFQDGVGGDHVIARQITPISSWSLSIGTRIVARAPASSNVLTALGSRCFKASSWPYRAMLTNRFVAPTRARFQKYRQPPTLSCVCLRRKSLDDCKDPLFGLLSGSIDTRANVVNSCLNSCSIIEQPRSNSQIGNPYARSTYTIGKPTGVGRDPSNRRPPASSTLGIPWNRLAVFHFAEDFACLTSPRAQ